MVAKRYDRIIIGAGIYGLYAATQCGRRGDSVLVLEKEAEPFSRATYINQARVHQGYHYPRSISTAQKSAKYFDRFCKDYSFCINGDFEQVYATSTNFSWSDSSQFEKFCNAASIPCEAINPDRFFKPGSCDGAFITQEYTYDAMILRDHMMADISSIPNVRLECLSPVERITRNNDRYTVHVASGAEFESSFVLNASYASTNEIIGSLAEGNGDKFKIKYELCEIILCEAGAELQHYGFTLMDGPFFSIMPFGKTGLHSLTSVTFTPHLTSYDLNPTFPCQKRCEKGYCTPDQLGNCSNCNAHPSSAFPFMANLARKYLRDEISFKYKKSLYSMKPILVSSEIDDSRPTVIKTLTRNPTFASVLSGKINTIYDLDEVLEL